MPVERTLSIIKPDAVARNVIGEILSRFEKNGLCVVAARMLHMTREQAGGFYAEHEGKPFYEPLLEFMSSGPVAAAVVEGEGCIPGFRSIAGATNPTDAAPGSIRGDLGRDWGTTVQQNIVHGSDSPESATREIGIWFPEL
jgi:nucleoside-diphosphate kinase